MAKVAVYTMNGAENGQIELKDSVFGVEVNVPVMHEAVVAHLANLRQGTQSALTRAEVRGGGRKPYRQKGTGRARQGSIRAPQWVGGGVVFAPKPRDYSKKMNKKARFFNMDYTYEYERPFGLLPNYGFNAKRKRCGDKTKLSRTSKNLAS